MLVGGAALSSNFVDKQIAKAYSGTVAYASDAMTGLELAKKIVDKDGFEALKAELAARRAKLLAAAPAPAPAPEAPAARSATVPLLAELPTPTDFDRHVLRTTPIEQIWRFVNPLMLYGRHLGMKGGLVRKLGALTSVVGVPDARARAMLAESEPKGLQIWDAVHEVMDDYKGTGILQPSAVYRYYRADSDGNRLRLYADGAPEPAAIFEFPRQRRAEGLCLADYVRPREVTGARASDSVAFFVVSVGKGIRQLAEQLKNRGDYLKSHILQALALESAEAYAELLHSQLRKTWGFPDAPEMTMMERFQAKYRGKRYSFGYPACPRLDDQGLLWKLLTPDEIGVQLTDGFMMDPESSVSALVFHHPDATYFSVGRTGEDDDDNRG